MGDSAHMLTNGDRLNVNLRDAHYGKLKRKALLDQTSETPKSMSIAERRNKEVIGREFSIISGRDLFVCWRVPPLNAALSGVFKHNHLKTATPELTAKLPAQFDPLVIDTMVNFIMYDSYRLTQPLQLKHAQGASGLNKNLTASLETTIPILIHLSIFEIGKFLDIPELATNAMDKIYYILAQRSKPMSVATYEKIFSKVWYEVDKDIDMDMHEDIHSLRCMIATYGTTMEYVFNKENKDLVDSLLSFDGKYKEYAKWHMEALKLRNQAMRHQNSPFIQALIAKDLKDAEEAEDTENTPEED